MRLLRTGTYTWTMVRWALAASFVLAPLGCSRIEASDQGSPALSPERAVQGLAAVSQPAVGAQQPLQPGDDGLDAFAQKLAHTLDPSRISDRPASAGGGILHSPNGYAAHAAVLVRRPDGTLRTACVSSAAEVSALVNQIRNGAGQ